MFHAPYEAAWLSKSLYHTRNLVLLIREHDGLDGSYTSLLIKDIIRDEVIERGDQRQLTSNPHSFRRRSQSPPKASNVVRSEMYRIDYEAQFYAELRAYHDAKYAWILLQEILRCPPTMTEVSDALLDDLNNMGPAPPPETPARPRPDDVERVFDTHICSDAPSMAALISDMGPELLKIVKTKIEVFRKIRHYFPPFLLEYKHGDGIPHFRPELTEFMSA
ncbi:hypothetical protein BOTBODRAFT_39066 [Botryobasidium botryosum FD-172 SS1]|uniref:Uncharacterized protein n=1 Tax=Botryobasidium botryosum (strain FD-172 SS1) TaxID=930990 RepID=A0A067M5I2_BOTB1|nr:hypothetical protein BOTBODRAFT_39066 [Botryobasidium botryosum FD-172 SS1]